jgi:UDP-N-acetylmuramoyl-tripeptide--D-alanyl-D-alanine ligase
MAKRQICSHVTYIGVTGSCGKSTTTNLIGTILSSAGRCQTLGGDNRPASVAANLLSISSSTDYCVQEISAHQPGALRKRTRMVRPQIGVVTNVGGDHYKSYRSLEAVAAEKSKLVQDLPRRGVAILNADDPHVRAMATCTRARVITYGHSPGADFRAIEVSSRWPDRLSVTIVFGTESLRIKTKLAGEYWATSILAAFACGISCGLDPRSCAEAIAGFEPLFARSSVHSVPNGPHYILDTGKAPYWTFENTFAFLQKALAPRALLRR